MSLQRTQSSSRELRPARTNLQPCMTLCRDPQPSHMGPLTNRNREILTDAVQSHGVCGHQLHTSRKHATWTARLLWFVVTSFSFCLLFTSDHFSPFTFAWILYPQASLGGSDSKESAYNTEDLGSIPGLGRSPGEGNGNPLWYSCLGNSMDRGVWWGTVHGVAKSWTWVSNYHIPFPILMVI